MSTSLRIRGQSQQLYTRALSAQWRNGIQLYDNSVWLAREPEIEEMMLRDADIAHAVDFRRRLVAGQRWAVSPRFETPRAPVAVSVATSLLQEIRNFDDARLALARAFFSGARFARIHWEPRTLTIGDGQRRTWLCPVRLEDLDKRMFRPVPRREQTEDGQGVITAFWEQWSLANEKWEPVSRGEAHSLIRHVYAEDQASLTHGTALREALGWWWFAKTNIMQETLTAVERFAQGLIVAKVDGIRTAKTDAPNSELIAEWEEVLRDLLARNVLVFDKDDSVEVVQPSGEGWQLMTDIRNELRTSIHTLVLGANLNTGATEGGSYALAQVHENSTEALLQFDRAALETTLSDQLIRALWIYNRPNLTELGIAEEPPLFDIPQDKRQDPAQRAQVAQTLNAMGVELSLDDVLDQTGFRTVEPGEPTIKPSPGGAGAFDFGQLASA